MQGDYTSTRGWLPIMKEGESASHSSNPCPQLPSFKEGERYIMDIAKEVQELTKLTRELKRQAEKIHRKLRKVRRSLK